MSARSAVIVAGGTGGHLYPGIALAHVLKRNGWTVTFVVRRGDLGRDILGREGLPVEEITGQGMPRKLSMKGFLFPISVLRGFLEAKDTLARLHPDVVIGMGGYLSFPVLASAKASGVATLIHEQNVLPGVANRVLSRIVNGIGLSFAESSSYFPQEKSQVTGLPIRSQIGAVTMADARQRLGISPVKRTLLVVGGSQGARQLNAVVAEAWGTILSQIRDVQILHISGAKEADAVQKEYADRKLSATILPYCHDMPSAYAAADLVICRAGASTIAELLAAERPAILVPFPFASADHQTFNAQVMASQGVGTIIQEKELTPSRLTASVIEFLNCPAEQMRARFIKLPEALRPQKAAERLGQFVEHTVRNYYNG